MKLDVLITTAHPDDAESAMGGTILKLLAEGKKVGICDFTRGELGTRGTAEIRDKEAAEADKRLGLTVRANLGFRDGFFPNDEEHVRRVIEVIRRFKPEIVFTNPPCDRHPDHGRAHDIAIQAAFLSGLPKIETQHRGKNQEAWRPARVFHYIQSHQHTPDFVVDVTAHWKKKINALKAYGTQFGKNDNLSEEPETVISREDIWDYFDGRGRAVGRKIGVTFGEGFLRSQGQPLKIEDVLSLA